MNMDAFERQREQMVAQQIAGRGIWHEPTLAAMRAVPREMFVPAHLQEYAYEDAPLPIDEGQTISQPFVVALMLQSLELKPEDRMLEIGAGSGYAAAVASRIVTAVYAIERHPSLAHAAQRRIHMLGYDNVFITVGDGTLGWPEHAPFDAILVSAGGPDIPHPLLKQLAIGGRLVIPVGSEQRAQELRRVRRLNERDFAHESLGHVQFVPLIGEAGW